MDDEEQFDVAERIGGLLYKFIGETITSDELSELYNWVYTSKENEEIFEHVVYSEEFQDSINYVQQIDVDAAYRSVQDRLGIKKVNVIELPAKKRSYFLAVAATIIIILSAASAGLYFGMLVNMPTGYVPVAQPYKNDPAPGGDRAVLILANGKTIVLDNARNGTLVQQGNTKISKLGSGQLVYTANTQVSESISYNTVATPRGGQYQVKLPDGSKVWLNAASSIRFPVAFIGTTRTVEIKGEAYFEIVNNKSRPFRVMTDDMEVEVLGTHFNINAYQDESCISTTLLEGSVKIHLLQDPSVRTNLIDDVTLLPGQQAQVGRIGGIRVVKEVDMENIIAWKNGLFQFKSEDLPSIMRQVARWYDVEISYENNLPERHFTGKISRNITASQLLSMLQYVGCHFAIIGKQIKVMR